MYETVMSETVMFIMLARVDFFKNTHLEQLGWEPHGIVHITTKLGWEPWRRALYTHQQRVEKYSRPGYDQHSLTRRLGWRMSPIPHA